MVYYQVPLSPHGLSVFADPGLKAGIGSTGGIFARVIGGATAQGLSENIRAAYTFIASKLVPTLSWYAQKKSDENV